MADRTDPAGPAPWVELARKERRGADPDGLVWHTPEGIDVKPLWTRADVEHLDFIDTLPGVFPFVRGPRASMYAWQPCRWASRSPSTSPPIAATTATIPGWSATSARPAWRSTRSRT